MLNNKQISGLIRVSLLLFVSLFFSLNTYAVKKSAAGITTKQIQESSIAVNKKAKPSFFQRLSAKVLTKKLTKQAHKNIGSSKQGDKLKKGFAVAALVLGILSFFLSFVGIITAILAIIFSVIAKKRIKNNPEVYGGKGMATAGLVLGIIALAILAAVFGFLLLFSLAG